MKGIIPQTTTRRIVVYLAKILPLSDSEKMKGGMLLNNVFGEIRDRVSMQDVAKFYGLQMNRSGMACCPFHEGGTKPENL